MAETPKQLTRLLRLPTHHSHLFQLHAAMIKTSHFPHHPFPTSKLLSSPLCPLPYALSLFSAIPHPTLFHHTALLHALSVSASPSLPLAASVFASARARLPFLDAFAFQPLLALCAKNPAAACSLGRQVHAVVVQYGFLAVVGLGNVLSHFYWCCGNVGDARRMFDEMPVRDVVSWSTMIGGFAKAGEVNLVVGMFRGMRCSGVGVSVAAVVGMVGCGCGGESVHGFCIKAGFGEEVRVAAATVGMYVREGNVESARKVFDEAVRRDLVLYNCMVDGYAKAGHVVEVMGLVDRMGREGVRPSAGTLVGVLSACALSGELVVGRRVHELVGQLGLELDVTLGTALLDMYLKNGCLDRAVSVFERMRDKDVKAWTAMIMGYGVNGRADTAVSLFHDMEEDGVVPNEVTFLAVLSACSHGGLVLEGKMFLESMVRRYGLAPKSEHYGCIIDLMGRAGQLVEAYELIKSLSSQGDPMAWRALLAACRVHGNAKLGRTVQAHLYAIGDYHPSDAILLSTTYALEGRWDDIAQVRDAEGQKVSVGKKEAAWSSIEVSR